MGDSQESLKKQWSHISKVLERAGPFSHPEFEPSCAILDYIMTSCKVLVVGAGGLGCELLKDLTLMGFKHIDVIDMDTIDLSNLNRQFLFRRKDIGKSKAIVAADFINKRVIGANVTSHFARIEDYGEEFYGMFNVIVCGLDSIAARRWINGMLVSMLRFEDGVLDQSSIIPLVDGGTEGFKGNARVIVPGMSACIDCTLDFYPPQVNYPLCTIANTPRLPEHCIEYVKILQWPSQNPFGVPIDGDDPQHINWIYEKSIERGAKFNITGVNYRLTQGVIKNIIPAVASTNSAIAAVCATEVFKLATSCCISLNNYMIFNDVDGIYTYSFAAERKEDCLVCSQVPQTVNIDDPTTMKLKSLIELLCETTSFKLKNPGLTTVINGKSKTLYMSTIRSIEERTRDNLQKSLAELELKDGANILVADITSPTTLCFKLKFLQDNMQI